MGGGLGSYVAELLSSHGWRVKLYEKNPRRHVVCGGLISDSTLRNFPFLEDYVVHRIDGAVITAGRSELVVERRGAAWVLDRDLMFRGMLERASSEGAEVIYGVWRGEVEGKLLVGADGALSHVRSRVTGEKVSLILGYQGRAPWSGDEDLVRVDFGPWSPNFFGWLIPLGDGEALVGIGLPVYMGGEARARLLSYARFLGLSPHRLEGRIIPISPPLKRVARKSSVLVGDAGVFVKASTGGGLSYGLLAIEQFLPTMEKFLGGEISSLETINSLHKKMFYPRLKLHWAIHRFYNEANMEEVIGWAGEGEIGEYLSRKGDMDDPSWVLSPRLLGIIFRTFVPFLKTLPELL